MRAPSQRPRSVGARRDHCTVALAVGTSFSRVVKRGERISNLVDQLRFSTKPARAGTTAPRPNRLLQASIAAISAPDFSRSCASNRGRGRPTVARGPW